MLFWRRISSTSGRRSDIIVLDNVSKIWIELIKYRNHNAGEKFNLVPTFSKVQILVEILKILKNQEHKKFFGGRSCSTSYPSGNLVDGHRSLPFIYNVGLFEDVSVEESYSDIKFHYIRNELRMSINFLVTVISWRFCKNFESNRFFSILKK